MKTKGKSDKQEKKDGFFTRIFSKIVACYDYVNGGVWNDPKNTVKTRIVKTLNLTLNAFFDSSLQNKSMALTYSTVLSIVPAFALLVAIGRGFGLQNLLIDQLYKFVPSQGESIATALKFVDSYLSTATQGVFVGIGLIVLLWTVISLLSSIEDTFNSIWDVSVSRTLYQKFTDYIAICLMIPVLIICSSGMSLFLSDMIQSKLDLPFITPLVNIGLELVPLVLCWLAFTLSYYLIPHTKVQFKYAAISGAMAAVSFQILQMLFMNGQLYVSKYNAIYGSFAFLPLLLIWLQLSWLVLLTGCMITYSMQNVFTFNLMGDINSISNKGWHNVALIVMTVCVKRFINQEKPLTIQEIAVNYCLPIRIVTKVNIQLKKAKLIYEVNLGNGSFGLTPAVEPNEYTVSEFYKTFDNIGKTEIVPYFNELYKRLLEETNPLQEDAYEKFNNLLVKNLPLPSPQKINEIRKIEAK